MDRGKLSVDPSRLCFLTSGVFVAHFRPASALANLIADARQSRLIKLISSFRLDPDAHGITSNNLNDPGILPRQRSLPREQSVSSPTANSKVNSGIVLGLLKIGGLSTVKRLHTTSKSPHLLATGSPNVYRVPAAQWSMWTSGWTQLPGSPASIRTANKVDFGATAA